MQSTNDLHIKGLVYSSNKRVKAVNEAFGGLRSHIIYEVDTRYLEDGDEIKGSFYLVTNGGEREIPYSLRIQTENGGGGTDLPKDSQGLCKPCKEERGNSAAPL
ncbi:DUF5717 family protein [Enterocloster sp.]|uniref:DUF5717 family protein n=1 Tax=Enterocloster sp. TaxID=2719315 RepID=UPI0039A2160A